MYRQGMPWVNSHEKPNKSWVLAKVELIWTLSTCRMIKKDLFYRLTSPFCTFRKNCWGRSLIITWSHFLYLTWCLLVCAHFFIFLAALSNVYFFMPLTGQLVSNKGFSSIRWGYDVMGYKLKYHDDLEQTCYSCPICWRFLRIEQRPASLPNLTNEHSHNALGKSQKNHWHT